MSFENERGEYQQLPDNFSGIVRLFPLPGLVLFPGVVQALHIFEPRYRKMMEDTLAGDHTIAMCLPKEDSAEPPEIHDVICIGKVVAHAELEDGRYNLLLQGVSRAKIVRELGVDQPYRMAEVEVLPDVDDVDDETKANLRNQIRQQCEQVHGQKIVKQGLESDVFEDSNVWQQLPIGLLVDLICFSLPISGRDRQTILETQDVAARGRLLLKFAKALSAESSGSKVDFPPGFSLN